MSTLWVSNSGRIACPSHGGGYLQAAVQQSPRRKTHITPLDHWTQVDALMQQVSHEEYGETMTCETCP